MSLLINQFIFNFLVRTGSKLGISPLMLAAMNGHVPAVKLLLDMGSDINAQIETNRNTALTLACFQGRAEVVSLLLDRKANVEHRAKVSSLFQNVLQLTRCVSIGSTSYCKAPSVHKSLLNDSTFLADWSHPSDGGSLRRLCRGGPSAPGQRC